MIGLVEFIIDYIKNDVYNDTSGVDGIALYKTNFTCEEDIFKTKSLKLDFQVFLYNICSPHARELFEDFPQPPGLFFYKGIVG